MFPSAILSGAFFGTTVFLASDLRVRQLSVIAAVSTLSILPYTAIFMLPTNEALAEIESVSVEALKGKEEKALDKVDTWRARHVVRIVLGAVGWVAGVVALEIL